MELSCSVVDSSLNMKDTDSRPWKYWGMVNTRSGTMVERSSSVPNRDTIDADEDDGAADDDDDDDGVDDDDDEH